MMSGRRKKPRGKTSKQKKRSERTTRKKRGPTPPEITIESSRQAHEHGEGVRVIEPRAVAKMNTLADYMRAGVLSQEQTDAIYKRMGLIAAKEEPRYAIPAYRVMLARAKLAYDIDRGPSPTVNIDARDNAGGVGVFGIASELGIAIHIADDGGASGDHDVVPGTATRVVDQEPPGETA